MSPSFGPATHPSPPIPRLYDLFYEPGLAASTLPWEPAWCRLLAARSEIGNFKSETNPEEGVGGLPRVRVYGTPRMHGACLPLCSAPVPCATKLRDFTPGRLWGCWSPGGVWSWLGNEKGHRVGSWKANRARGVDTHAPIQGQPKCPYNGICGHTQTQTHTEKQICTQQSQGKTHICRNPEGYSGAHTHRHPETHADTHRHKGYIDIHTSTAT